MLVVTIAIDLIHFVISIKDRILAALIGSALIGQERGYIHSFDSVGGSDGIDIILDQKFNICTGSFSSFLIMKGFFRLFSKIKNHMGFIQKIRGAILVILEILIITGKLTLITAKLGFFNGLV